MSRYDLASFVSGSIARSNPLEGGPELEAMLSGSRIIASTWGDYATRLMDLTNCEPHEAIGMLRLDAEMLADPTVHFNQGHGFDQYEDRMLRAFQQEAEADLMTEVRRLHNIVDTVMQGYLLPDPIVAQEQAAGIQYEISKAMPEEHDSESSEQYEKEQAIRCMERDALYDGVRIQLDDFVTTMLGTNVIDPEFGSELGQQWVEAIMLAVEDFWREHVKPDLLIGEMVAGRDVFVIMKQDLQSGAISLARKYAAERWKQIEPIFTARTLADLPLINGSDATLAQ